MRPISGCRGMEREERERRSIGHSLQSNER